MIVKQDYGSGLENDRLTTLMYFKRKCCIYLTKMINYLIRSDSFFVKEFVPLLLGTHFFLFTKYLYLVFPISTGRTLAFVGVYSLKYVNCNNISLIYGKLKWNM